MRVEAPPSLSRRNFRTGPLARRADTLHLLLHLRSRVLQAHRRKSSHHKRSSSTRRRQLIGRRSLSQRWRRLELLTRRRHGATAEGPPEGALGMVRSMAVVLAVGAEPEAASRLLDKVRARRRKSVSAASRRRAVRRLSRSRAGSM